MDNKEKITKLYMSGVPVTEIADMFGVTREAIYQKLRRLEGWRGIKRLHSNYRSSERLTGLQDSKDDIIAGWLAGVTIGDLSKEFKTIRKNVSDMIKEEFGSTKRRYKRDLEIIESYKNGMTQVELSKKYGISQPCISRIVNALND